MEKRFFLTFCFVGFEATYKEYCFSIARKPLCNCRNNYFCCHSGLHKYIVLYKRIKSGLSLPKKGNPEIGGWGMNRTDI